MVPETGPDQDKGAKKSLKRVVLVPKRVSRGTRVRKRVPMRSLLVRKTGPKRNKDPKKVPIETLF